MAQRRAEEGRERWKALEAEVGVLRKSVITKTMATTTTARKGGRKAGRKGGRKNENGLVAVGLHLEEAKEEEEGRGGGEGGGGGRILATTPTTTTFVSSPLDEEAEVKLPARATTTLPPPLPPSLPFSRPPEEGLNKQEGGPPLPSPSPSPSSSPSSSSGTSPLPPAPPPQSHSWFLEKEPHPLPPFGLDSPVVAHLLDAWTQDDTKLEYLKTWLK